MNNIRTVSINFYSKELASLFSREEVSKVLTDLSKYFGKYGTEIIPEDGNAMSEYEWIRLYYLWLAFNNIEKCKGFDLHVKEYSNNIETTFFITLLADILVAHGLNVELEPSIDNQDKKPDLVTVINNQQIYFEGKQPQDPSQDELANEQRKMFRKLLPIIENKYSLSIFYDKMLSDKQIENFVDELSKVLENIEGEGEIYSNEALNISVVVSGLGNNFHAEASDLEILGIPTFNKNLCLANAFNCFGKNIIFYKKATPYNRVINEQLRKSRNKVPAGEPYVIIIDASTSRYDIEDIEKYLEKRFRDGIAGEKDISGVLLTTFQMDPENLVVVSMRYIPNFKSDEPLIWLKEFFQSSYGKIELKNKRLNI